MTAIQKTRPARAEVKIRSEKLNLWYGSFQALKDVSISIRPRCITAIIGPSGCGKSTLLRCFNRLNERIGGVRIEGEIHLDGRNIYESGMDLMQLKKDFGDRIVFNGCIDSHHVLINGNPDSVKSKTMEVLNIMMPGGGFIAGASHDSILEETPVENVIAMFDTVMEAGNY